MHLLLASQRLDEGHLRGLDSHLRFRICLRTFSPAESTAVLGVPDAYHLPAAPGTALVKVDASPPVPFTAALASTGPGPPGTAPRRPVHQVWLPPLAGDVALDPLLGTAAPGWLQVPVGVVDRPLDQVQEPLVLDLSGAAGHLAVVGRPGPARARCSAPWWPRWPPPTRPTRSRSTPSTSAAAASTGWATSPRRGRLRPPGGRAGPAPRPRAPIPGRRARAALPRPGRRLDGLLARAPPGRPRPRAATARWSW